MTTTSPPCRPQAAHRADWLDPITSQPQARWLNGPKDLAAVPRLVTLARGRGQLPVFVAYYIPNRGCTDFKQSAPDTTASNPYVRDWSTPSA